MSALAAKPLCGIVPPLVTPLEDEDRLDVGALERIVKRVLEGGVHGLFLLGTCGEGAALSYRLRDQVVQRVCQQVGGRVPVLASITDPCLAESLAMARRFADAGADLLVLAPPFYLPADPAELWAYVRALVAQVPRPVLLYNMPRYTKVWYDLDTVRRCLDLPRIVGMKDSSGDMTWFLRVLKLARAREDWSVLMGPEGLLAAGLVMGGHGGVCGGAHILPRLYIDLYEASQKRDLARVAQLHDRVLQLNNRIYDVAGGDPSSAVVKGIKCALSCMGLCADRVAPPLQSIDEPGRGRIRAGLRELGVLSEG